MSTDKKSSLLQQFLRSVKVCSSQFLQNREYFYFWILATVMDIALIEAAQPVSWVLLAFLNLLIGVIAVSSAIRPIDRAFESLGLDYSIGYGKPQWIVDGKYPLSQEVIRINAAGYSAADYERSIAQLASRLNQPIKEIRKPSAQNPVVEVVLKRSHLPDALSYSKLILDDLKPGEFFVGQSDDGLQKLALKSMVHMLVAGQTGAGKTQFIRQLMATILTQTRESYVALIDMKGGIDFQPFSSVPNFKMITSHDEADILLDEVTALFEARKSHLLMKKKTNWSEFSLKELANEESMRGLPIGPVVVVIDELAELSKKATEKSSRSVLQEKIATLARLSRFTGIHLVLGTQRPDKNTIDMQSKDNLPTRICFSVPSVTASTLVVGDMSASTLGNIPGRAVFQLSGSKVIQAPLIENDELGEMLSRHSERLKQQQFDRHLGKPSGFTPGSRQRVLL